MSSTSTCSRWQELLPFTFKKRRCPLTVLILDERAEAIGAFSSATLSSSKVRMPRLACFAVRQGQGWCWAAPLQTRTGCCLTPATLQDVAHSQQQGMLRSNSSARRCYLYSWLLTHRHCQQETSICRNERCIGAAMCMTADYLVCQQQTYCLKALLATVHIVAEEQVVGLRREATILKEPQQV